MVIGKKQYQQKEMVEKSMTGSILFLYGERNKNISVL